MEDAKLYCCNPVDDALHYDPRPGFFEWWYFDGVFDDGWSFVTSWYVNGIDTGGGIRFAAYDPQGNRTDALAAFPASETTLSQATCDVRMGENYIRGEYPLWEMRFREGELGCELRMRNLTQGVRTPPDGGHTFSEEPYLYMGWVIAQPRAEVTGHLSVGGRRFPVRGVGYHDHNWGVGGAQAGVAGEATTSALAGLFDYWYWGRLYLPNHTIIYSTGRSAETLGRQTLNGLVALAGETLIARSEEVDSEESGLVRDEATGAEYPQELVVKLRDERVQGDISLRLRKLIESWPFGPRGTAISAFSPTAMRGSL